jgi:hypothetical protein
MATNKHTVINHPVARSQRVLVEAVDNETVIYDLDTNVAHALKPLAAAVYTYADGKNNVEAIAELASYRLAEQITATQVTNAIAQLDALNLLETHELDVDAGGFSRRDALKVLAATGAGMALVSSVAAPAALAAGSQTDAGDGIFCPGGTDRSEGGGKTYIAGPSGAQYPQPTEWLSSDAPAAGIVFGGTCAYTSGVANDATCTPAVASDGSFKAITSSTVCTYFGGHISGGVCVGFGVKSITTSTSNKNTCQSNSGAYAASTDVGSWKCVPCDGSLGYQCCSVVCAPTSLTGYHWGIPANTSGLEPGWFPYVGCGYTGSGTDTSGACANGTNEGKPDYTNVQFMGKFCTANVCGSKGGCKS